MRILRLDHLVIRTRDIGTMLRFYIDADELTRHFARHGVELSPVYENYGAEGTGPSIYFKDPEMNTIELKGPSGDNGTRRG